MCHKIVAGRWDGASAGMPGRRDRAGRVGWTLRLSLAGIASLAMLPAAAWAEAISMPVFTELAGRCGASVHVATLAAIAKTESGFRPHVVADNSTRRSRSFEDADAATALAERLIAQGHSVDLGLMQINSANLRRLGYSARDALDPCRSVSGGARILTENYRRSRGAATSQIALRDALSRYNTGNARAGYRNGYVRRVELAAQSLIPWMMQAGGATVARLAAPAILVARPAVAVARRATATTAATAADWWNVWGGLEHAVAAPSAAASAAVRADSILVF
jgi:type IV secretion system protein VirB1